MANINQLFTSGASSVEIGKIISYQGNSLYKVIIDGETKLVYNTLNEDLNIGLKVILNRSARTGKRFIVGNAGTIGQNAVEEVFRNG